MAGRLEGQVAWVSGANKGIGAGIARLFAAEGAKVAMIGRTESEGKAIEEELRAQGHEAFFCKCDVTDEAQVKASIEKTVEKYGKLDILINNAGTVGVTMLHEYTYESWTKLMDINVTSMFFAFKHAFPYLSRQKKSYVVNVGSISSFVAQDCTPVYTTSKHAVLGLSKSIACDYARYGIRCNCVCPGITDTPLLHTHLNTEKDPAAHYKKRLTRVPTNETLWPEDIASTVLYFSCEDSRGVTGTSLVIDGGYLTVAEWDASKYEV